MYLETPPKLVIFDCDGVLVNSEPIFNRVLHAFLLSCGAEMSFAECCDFFTGKSKGDVEQYLSGQGLDFPQDWSVAFYDQALDALKQEVTPIKGAAETLAVLGKAKIPFCVASNGLMAKMRVTLERTQMLHLFEGSMFSAYEIGPSKPAPDVFLHAAKHFNVHPAACVVVEDSASGFEAAARAGMTCFGYLPNGVQPAADTFGAHPFRDMNMLPRMLGLGQAL